jgi:hypothetical protein
MRSWRSCLRGYMLTEPSAEKACEAAEACRPLVAILGPEWLSHIEDIILEMRSVVAEFPAEESILRETAVR